MLSRVALRSGSLVALAKPHISGRCMVAVTLRSNSTSTKDESLAKLHQTLDNWDKANDVYYGKERDTKNFPHPTQPETAPPTRMGVFPESWFKMFYDKTGVTGPYMFGVGAITFLLSKEYWVVEHQFMEFLSFWIATIWLTKKIGPSIRESYNSYVTDYSANHWDGPLKSLKDNAQQAIDETNKALWREEGQKYLFEAKKENVDLQLEAAYRKQLSHVHQTVKRRLDYHVAVENTKTRFQQEHMVNWVVDGVMQGITPQQQKDSIKKCIADLKAMSAKA